jgi:hypothetical protein
VGKFTEKHRGPGHAAKAKCAALKGLTKQERDRHFEDEKILNSKVKSRKMNLRRCFFTFR